MTGSLLTLDNMLHASICEWAAGWLFLSKKAGAGLASGIMPACLEHGNRKVISELGETLMD